MIIGVPREIKSDEYRIAMMPVGAELLVQDGHTVLIERGAGLGSGFDDDSYASAGATLLDAPEEIYERSDMIMTVKEPQPAAIDLMRPGQTVFCYFHFAASRELTEACLERRITAVAYETLYDKAGRLPMLTPMSEVAGKMSIQEGAKFLEMPLEGRGILLGGVPGVAPANVLVLGGGVVGTNAAQVAAGMGANVVIMDISLDRLRYLDEISPANITTIYCDPHAVKQYAQWADLVVGAVLIPGGRAPQLINAELISKMKTGAVVVDVCIDQGGSIETARPTTHAEPIYIIDDVVHYCVANMPGAVGRTSTHALCNATLPYTRQLAARGVDGFMQLSPGHAESLNMRDGKITNEAVAETFEDLPRV